MCTKELKIYTIVLKRSWIVVKYHYILYDYSVAVWENNTKRRKEMKKKKLLTILLALSMILSVTCPESVLLSQSAENDIYVEDSEE